MSVKINRANPTSSSLPNSNAPQAQGSRPSGSGHASIFSKPLFARAPRHSSTSMAPRDTIPLLSAEQRAAPSAGPAPSGRSGSRMPLSALLSQASKAMSNGAKAMSSGMHQAGKAMSGAYQLLNPSSHRPSHAGYVRLEQDASAYQGVESGSPSAVTPQRVPPVRPEAALPENDRPPLNGQGGRPHGTGPAPGRDAPPMPSSRRLAPLGTHTGNLPQATVRHRPATGGTENVNPNISHPTRHAAVKKNLPAFAESFKRGRMDRTFEPKQLVEAMVGLSKHTQFEQTVSQEIARNPQWGLQMQQRWNTLRNSLADARDDGQAQVPSLEYIIAKRPASFIRFMGGGDERSFARLMRPERHTAPAQTPVAPQVPAQPRPARPHRRDDVKAQPRHTEHAVLRPGRNESKPADARTRLTAALKNLDQQIAASEQKGKEILGRMFAPATKGPAVAAATRESYAHKAQHIQLIAARNQVQAQVQRVGSGAAAGQPAGRPKVDAVLERARATVAKGPPDLGSMYSTAIERVERNNDITQNSTLLEPEDKHMEHVDFAAIEKKYAGRLARYNKAKAMVDAADNPERARAQAAAFKAAVRAEAYRMAKQAYQSDMHDARDTVKQGPVSYDQVLGWARAAADQNDTAVGSQHLDHDAIVRDHDGINQRFEAARQFLAKPLTREETAARIDAQMAEAERRVRQRQAQAGPG